MLSLRQRVDCKAKSLAREVTHASLMLRPPRMALITVIAVIALIALIALNGAAVRAGDDSLTIRTSAATGVARFVTGADGLLIDVAPAAPGRIVEPFDFFRTHRSLFGMSDPDKQLTFTDRRTDTIGRTRTTFHQVHQGVPVFGGVLRVHTNAQGGIVAVNGTFVPDLDVAATPTLRDTHARRVAVDEVLRQSEGAKGLISAGSRLYVYRVNLARGVPGPNHLVYEVEVIGLGVREFVYVDAHTGKVVDQITGVYDAINRRVYDGGFGDPFLV